MGGTLLWPVQDLDGREERDMGSDPPTYSCTPPPQGGDLTSQMEDSVFVGWGEAGGDRLRGVRGLRFLMGGANRES